MSPTYVGFDLAALVLADGAEVRLYGTEQTRTLEIVATAPPPDRVPETTDLVPEIPEPLVPEVTEQTTGPSKSR